MKNFVFQLTSKKKIAEAEETMEMLFEKLIELHKKYCFYLSFYDICWNCYFEDEKEFLSLEEFKQWIKEDEDLKKDVENDILRYIVSCYTDNEITDEEIANWKRWYYVRYLHILLIKSPEMTKIAEKTRDDSFHTVLCFHTADERDEFRDLYDEINEYGRFYIDNIVNNIDLINDLIIGRDYPTDDLGWANYFFWSSSIPRRLFIRFKEALPIIMRYQFYCKFSLTELKLLSDVVE